jgi:prepilin-type N-terminal cleavage/methylation domain-containing protein
MKSAHSRAASGFTLIELLVVIAIIGLLATTAVLGYSVANQRSRDTRRKADLRQISKALELYFDDNGAYPPSPCGYNCNSYYFSYNANWATFQAYLAPYMDVPIDPTNESCTPWANCHSYTYGNVSDATNATLPDQYDLTTNLESTSDPDRCALKHYVYFFDQRQWCGSYSGQIFEASPK